MTGSTADLARGVVESLVHLTGFLTLAPGDLVLTGCPGTALPLGDGDTVTAAVDGLGELTNPVRPATFPHPTSPPQRVR